MQFDCQEKLKQVLGTSLRDLPTFNANLTYTLIRLAVNLRSEANFGQELVSYNKKRSGQNNPHRQSSEYFITRQSIYFL